MREITLIKDIEYNKRYQTTIDKETEKKSYDDFNISTQTVKLSKEVYMADEIVTLTNETESIVLDVKNSFINTFDSRGGATQEQINFAEQTAKIVFGQLIENIITVIPAPCGFGKSSISLEILKKMIQMHKNNLMTDGLILVTDRLDSLRKTQEDLKELGLDGYVYILEGWNENICLNKKVKSSDSKMCTPNTCSYFYKCKIYEQQNEQNKFPILLITNARLRECGVNIKQYSTWEKGNRNILLIDERPDVLDTIKINKKLLNEISTEISRCEYSDTQEKTTFENMFNEIANNITGKMQKLRKHYKRFIMSNMNNEPICKTDIDFMLLWDKYMRNNYKRELEHIHTILTKGGLYVYESNTEFISTIGSRDLKDMYCDTFKTIIFDGTALYDPLYLGMYKKKSIKYLDIENTRLYSNLNIEAYLKHKLTKTTFKDKKHLILACAKLVNAKMKLGFKKAYVVTYQTIAHQLNDLIFNKSNVVKLNDELFYFGNTKGKNNMQDCNIMFQFGWDTLPDYEYAIQWLSVCVDWDMMLGLNDTDKFEKYSEYLTIKDRSVESIEHYTYEAFGYTCYEFGFSGLNQFKMFTLVTNFYQEVHRIKLRNYNCTKEKIEVNIFSIQSVILQMIEQLFPECNMNKIDKESGYFKESKAEDRKNKAKGYDEFIKWFNEWDGNIIKISDIQNICKINSSQWKTLSRNPLIEEKLNSLIKPKRGCYSKV